MKREIMSQRGLIETLSSTKPGNVGRIGGES